MRKSTWVLGGVLALVGVAVCLYGCFSLPRDPNALPVGAAAPQAAGLLDGQGRAYDLDALNPGGYRVLVFYRGAW